MYVHNAIAKSPLHWEAEASPLDTVGKVSLSTMNKVGDSDLPAWATKSPKYCTPINKKVWFEFPEMNMHWILQLVAIKHVTIVVFSLDYQATTFTSTFSEE